ncbi:MAG: DUF4349 domain-containing protein [Clostridia bacterium]|nr:DUF4349 domain-containing protein [Clostridia bacterium]
MSKSSKMRKFLTLLLALILVSFTLVSCASPVDFKSETATDDFKYYASTGTDKEVYNSSSGYLKEEVEYDGSYDYSSVGKVEPESGSYSDPLEGRKIIKNVSIVAETLGFEIAMKRIEDDVAASGGYIQASNVYGKTYEGYSDRVASYTLRIPATKLDSFVSGLSGTANIISKTSSVDDITETYTDIESRLTSLRTQETRLLELLSKSGSLSELLTIEERLSSVRYEIERYTARLRGYNTLIDFSTVKIELREVIEYTPEPIKAPTFGQRISKAFTDSWDSFADGCKDLAVNIVYSLPVLLVLLVIAIIMIIVVVAIAKRKRRAKAKKNNENNE